MSHASWVAKAAWGVGILGCSLLLAGCAGGGGSIPEPRIYRIAVPPPSNTAASPRPLTLGVAVLGGAETYRQERLVYRTTPYQVAFYPYDRWEMAPVEMVTDALIGHLRGAGLFRRVVPYGRDGRADYVLRGRLLRFDQEDTGSGTQWTAVVELEYQVVDPLKGDVLASGTVRATRPVEGREPAAIVRALSVATGEALGSLGPQVAGAIPAGPR